MIRRLAVTFCASVVLGAASVANGAVVFQNLGTAAPPATVGTYMMSPFDTAPQAAIPDTTLVTTIPGSPIAGSLTSSVQLYKDTIPTTWSTWSHGYTGPAFDTNLALSTVLTLPPNAGAFYFYAEPFNFGSFTIQAVTDSGTSSGPVVVSGNAGATGFAFYTTAGESIATITVTGDAGSSGFAMAEFAIATSVKPIPVLGPWGLTAAIVTLLAVGLFVLRGREGVA